MKSNSWKKITPSEVANQITFDRDSINWDYKEGDTSMAARQTEGVAGLWNKLRLYNAALLADEVGTGKTLQVLGVMALLWCMKPKAKVLVIAPNKDICNHWEGEYFKFVKSHYKESDDKVRCKENNKALHAPKLVWSLDELPTAVKCKNQHFFITTIHSLSGLTRGNPDKNMDKLHVAKAKASLIHCKIKKEIGKEGFDLVIVDEAHYFRNKNSLSQRAVVADKFFGQEGARLGMRMLMITATPSYKSMTDVKAILSYITEVGEKKPEDLLKKLSLRRLRRMSGLLNTHDKYSYRNETVVRSDIKTPSAEMFFALYQKRLSQQSIKEGKSFLYGYLEGFESFESLKAKNQTNTSEEDVSVDTDAGESLKMDFHSTKADRHILEDLAKIHRKFGNLPEHPKYDVLVKSCLPDSLYNVNLDVNENKHLIFARRIPSVREITKRINTDYDKLLGQMIVNALSFDITQEQLKKWELSNWSRDGFNSLVNKKKQFDDDSPPETADQIIQVNEEGEDPDVHSRVSNLFVVKQTGSDRSTDCSNFSLRLRKPESLFCLLLEPASNYRDKNYTYHYKSKVVSERPRDDYASSALEERGLLNSKKIISEKHKFEEPLGTMWGLIYKKLDQKEKKKIDKLICNKQAENFGHYLKNGYLFASPVIVELYCWYVEFRRANSKTDVQHRYAAFLDFINDKLANSLAFAYFKSALNTFEAVRENYLNHVKSNWNVLKGLTSPAFYASGAVNDRQRLITGFNTPFYPNVLVSTSVLQEGVNLHLQCRKVHHYGIAWTPGANEQRVGRVDRLYGKINSLLKSKGDAELAIQYPYLARSFDEEQLASFIREKYFIEDRMDACREFEINSEIDISNSSEHWTSFLRTKNNQIQTISLDPYPYNPNEEK